MRRISFKSVMREFSSFLLFFLMVGFVVSCCMMLFLQILETTMELEYTAQNIAAAAKITFINVLIISIIFKTIDYLRRKVMVDKPVEIITEATERIMQGDFTVRVNEMHGAGMEGFNLIGL